MQKIKFDRKIKNSVELEFAVFCIENIAQRMGVNAERIYKALAEKSDILNSYIVPEYEILHTQGKDYIVDDILELMKEKGVEVYDKLQGETSFPQFKHKFCERQTDASRFAQNVMILYHGSFLEMTKPDLKHSRVNVDFGRGFYITPIYEQAEKWCGKFKRRGKEGIISRYTIILKGANAYECEPDFVAKEIYSCN